MLVNSQQNFRGIDLFPVTVSCILIAQSAIFMIFILSVVNCK